MATRLFSFCIRPARPADLDTVESLLAKNNLPTAGVREAFDDFFIAEADAPPVRPMHAVGAIGFERYEAHALLRSAVLAAELRGMGFGRQLVMEAVEHARSSGVSGLYLLTTSAESFFSRLGFRIVSRPDVPALVRGSVEFTSACPDTAVAMALDLTMPLPR